MELHKLQLSGSPGSEPGNAYPRDIEPPAQGKRSMPFQLLDAWNQRLRMDLEARASKEREWNLSEKLVRNTDEGFRHGNLVADFIRIMHIRLFGKPFQTEITADDPDFVQKAEDVTIVTKSISRIADLQMSLFEAAKDSAWASTGWLEVGHPMDPYSSDIMRSVYSPNIDQNEMIPDGKEDDLTSSYEEIPPGEAQRMGFTPENVLPFDPFQAQPTDIPQEPSPVFHAELGYPWIAHVDPRLVIIPFKAKKEDDLDYIGRIRFITRGELQQLHGVDFGMKGINLIGSMRDLFERVEGKDPLLFPEMMAIVELWIRRDRNNPHYNNWYVSYVYEQPDMVIHNEKNMTGGMCPLTPIRLNEIKGFYDTTLAKELTTFADMFDVGIQSVFNDMRRALNAKYLNTSGAGIKEPDERRLLDPNWSGVVNVNDANAVVRLKDTETDQTKLQMLVYIKSMAQAQTGASDIDQGKAIKSITASQTRALLEATGINVDVMKQALSRGGAKVLMKLMYLVGIYNHTGSGRKYGSAKNMVTMARGTHDFTNSFTYNVQLTDATDNNSEAQLAWMQFVKTLMMDAGGVMLPYIDREVLVKRTISKYGEDMGLLASRGAGREGTGLPSADPMVQAGQFGNIPGGGGAPHPLSLMDMANGQHPERGLGDRGGLSMSNALQGQMNVGRSR